MFCKSFLGEHLWHYTYALLWYPHSTCTFFTSQQTPNTTTNTHLTENMLFFARVNNVLPGFTQAHNMHTNAYGTLQTSRISSLSSIVTHPLEFTYT
eukprot:m.32865 g.32865  ORF g.32865 m.32865 type:complete len:96 (-) comp9559_c0_seq1:853-1140(-)